MEIKQRVNQFFLDDILREDNGFELQDTSNLIEGGIIDSLGIMKLLSFIEQTFQIQISNDELVPENFETIERICALITDKTIPE